MKPVRLSGHAKEQIYFRGVSEGEVHEAIRTSPWGPAELGRLQAIKDFVFEKEWNKRYYKTKRVRPIFVEEEAEITVITVYAYYFNEEREQ